MAHIHMENNILFENAMAPAARSASVSTPAGVVLGAAESGAFSGLPLASAPSPDRERRAEAGNARAEQAAQIHGAQVLAAEGEAGIHGAMAARALHVLAAQRARVEAPHRLALASASPSSSSKRMSPWGVSAISRPP